MATKAASVLGEVLEDPWPSGGCEQSQEKVRSTARRRGSTTKLFMSSVRLTISMCAGRAPWRLRHRLGGRDRRRRPRSGSSQGKRSPDAVKHQCRAVTVLHDAAECTTTRIGRPSVSTSACSFAPFQLLAGVVTHLVVLTAPAPFSADFSVWLSSTAALGLASRPRRFAQPGGGSSAQIASQTPSRWNLTEDVVDRRTRREGPARQIPPRTPVRSRDRGLHPSPRAVGLPGRPPGLAGGMSNGRRAPLRISQVTGSAVPDYRFYRFPRSTWRITASGGDGALITPRSAAPETFGSSSQRSRIIRALA